MDVPAQIKAYEHLGGETGVRIRYRAPRYEARELFRGPFPVTLLNGAAYLLSDLSMSGLAAIEQSLGQSALTIGDEIPYELRFGDHILQEGHAGVVRTEETHHGRKIGLRFSRGIVDVDVIAKRYREEHMRTLIRSSFADIKSPVRSDLKFACLELLSQLRICRTALEALGEISSSEELGQLVSDCLVLIRPQISDLAQIGNIAIEESLDDAQNLPALKRLFERLISPEMLSSPLWARAIGKPVGYPGDFVLMRDVNRAPANTDAAFVTLLEALFREVFAWIPSRTQALSDLVGREFSAQRPQESLRVMVVGSGGIEELRLLVQKGRFSKHVDLTLVDQDERALGEAQKVIFEDCANHGGDVSMQCFHASHLQLQSDGELRGRVPQQHVILTPLLLDYLRHRPASQLVEALYALLAPGGALLAGCLRRHTESARWASELICDWSMIHRTKDEVVALATGLGRARVDVRSDARADNYLLAVRAPRSSAA